MASNDNAHFNENMPKEYWDYASYKISWSSPENYEIVRKIGRGKYSEVFEGLICTDNSRCVIKVLKPVRGSKVRREIKILRNLSGGVNIIELLDCVRDPLSGTPAMIFEYIGPSDFKEIGPTLCKDDIRYFMFELLRALEFCHSRGIMHRDVKPHNIVVDPETRQLRLIDWGLAEFYHPGTQNNVRVASRVYKGPELLVDLRTYDYGIDMWSFGCVFAALIFRIDPFFNGVDNYEQLLKISEVLGYSDLKIFLNKYDLKLSPKFHDSILKCRKVPWGDFVDQDNARFATKKAIDLIDRTLRYDYKERLTPRQAMEHSYFTDYNGPNGA